MSFSGKAVHRCFLSAGQEAFFEGHAHAFEVLGGVPFGKARYDNLREAASRMLGFARLGEDYLPRHRPHLHPHGLRLAAAGALNSSPGLSPYVAWCALCGARPHDASQQRPSPAPTRR
ncbi:hypothetical protein [Nocardia lijiangensis]|uniref:hypothetical protein n=1 Tax=Nocardia lijiangensis TaxID=299618 RepID=UPI00082B0C5C|nr:hypothetical protein [Nocardia lijiangensis]